MRRHRLDGVSLSFGMIFLVIVGLWLFGRAFPIGGPNTAWVVAGALIMFGLLGLIGVLRTDRNRPNGSPPDHLP